jgi:hypothetical protein
LCKALYEYYCDYVRLLSEADKTPIPEDILEAAREAARVADAGKVIRLTPLVLENHTRSVKLAADGEENIRSRISVLGTYKSDKPEMVLRITRDNDSGLTTLRLIGPSAAEVAGVVIESPQIGLQLVTDDSGCIELDELPAPDLSKTEWLIRVPDTVFSLCPYEYDPESVEYSREAILDSGRNDRIRISFEGRAEGKSMSLRVLEINGSTDYRGVLVVVSQGQSSSMHKVSSQDSFSFVLHDPSDSVQIRLFSR